MMPVVSAELRGQHRPFTGGHGDDRHLGYPPLPHHGLGEHGDTVRLGVLGPAASGRLLRQGAGGQETVPMGNTSPAAADQRRGRCYLMPPSMRDWLSEGHLAWFIVDAVGQMDGREFCAAYRSDGWGAAAYDPGMMVAILLYAYCLGLRSSRRIARALEEDVGFRVVAANRQPDFRTICRFRAEQEEALEEIFVEVVRLCHEAGLVGLRGLYAVLCWNLSLYSKS